MMGRLGRLGRPGRGRWRGAITVDLDPSRHTLRIPRGALTVAVCRLGFMRSSFAFTHYIRRSGHDLTLELHFFRKGVSESPVGDLPVFALALCLCPMVEAVGNPWTSPQPSPPAAGGEGVLRLLNKFPPLGESVPAGRVSGRAPPPGRAARQRGGQLRFAARVPCTSL